MPFTKQVFCLILLPVWFVSQACFGQDVWEFGIADSLIVEDPGEPLEIEMEGELSLESYAFVGKVGGVAFQGVAQPSGDLQFSSLTLQYIASNDDGRRLRAVFDADTAYAWLADWQLIPIARYADSPYHATISLFGERSTEDSYDIVYHPSLRNTLLGIRLLHADILLMNVSEYWRMPRFNGEIVLGHGEVAPDPVSWQNAAYEISKAMGGGNFQSWVLTDHSVSIQFKIVDGELSLGGVPYYHFWVSDMADYHRARNELVIKANKLVDKANQARANNDVTNFNKYVSERNDLVREANALEPKVSGVGRLTDRMRDKSQHLDRLNPNVYGAAVNTMRFAAFFRYVKQMYPESWHAFFVKLMDVSVVPVVNTPTTWKKKRRI
ncbi:hypothetical protein MJD09_15755 [bacterium]|nr:hypothetical protein [bacterium]